MPPGVRGEHESYKLRASRGGSVGDPGRALTSSVTSAKRAWHRCRGQHEAPAQAFDLEHRAEAEQHLVSSSVQSGRGVGLGGAEGRRRPRGRARRRSGTALQGVDDAPVEVVEGRVAGRRSWAGVHGAGRAAGAW